MVRDHPNNLTANLKVTSQSIETERQSLSNQDVIYARHTENNYLEPFVVSDYSDGGAAIQAAIDALPSGRTQPSIVDVVGDYDINAQITLPSYTWLNLTGARLTLQTDIATGGMLDYDEGEQIVVYGGLLDGNKANNGGSTDGVRVRANNPPENAELDDADNRLLYTQIKDFTGGGVVATSRRCLFVGVDTNTNDGNGFQIKSSDQSFVRCRSESDGGVGFRVQGGFNHFYHCIADECGVTGFRFTGGGSQNMVFGGYSEFCDNEGILVDNGSNTENWIIGHWLINNGQVNDSPAIEFDDNRNKAIGCTMYDDQGTPTQQEAVNLTANAADCWAQWNDHIDNPQGYTDAGTRNLVEGIGDNGTDDPSSAGDWNGNGREGVKVFWDNGGTDTLAEYISGSWYSRAL